MMGRVAALIVAIALCGMPLSASAASIDKAKAAMQRGDFKTALNQLRPLAAKSDPEAQLLLGMLYDAGKGVKQDPAAAASWYRKAAEQKHPTAQLFLGSMYAEGTGVKKDENEAIRWLEKSAAQRNTRAMGLLAAALFSRHRNDQDLVDAYVWSHLAAEYDEVQATTSARVLIEKYCDKDQKKRAERAMADWKKKWAGAPAR